MQESKISIARKTLKLLENRPLSKLKISEVLNKKNISIKSNHDLLKNINKYFDYLLNKNLNYLEKSSQKDMLFEVIMARLDILNKYRKSVKNLIKHFITHPKDFIKLIPSLLDSIISIALLSNINTDGVKSIPKIKIIFILYIIIIYTWYYDETASLEKTMTTLDKYLSNIDKVINIF